MGRWEQVGSAPVGRRGGGDTDILLHRASKKCLHTLFASAAKVPQLHPAPDLRLRGHARDPLTGLGPGLGARLPGLPRHPRLDIPSARPQRPHSPGQEIKPPSNHSGSRARHPPNIRLPAIVLPTVDGGWRAVIYRTDVQFCSQPCH